MGVHTDDHVARRGTQGGVPGGRLVFLGTLDDLHIQKAVVGILEFLHARIGQVSGHAVDKDDFYFFMGVFLQRDIAEQALDRLRLIVGDHT